MFFVAAALVLFFAVWAGYEWAWRRRSENYRAMVSAARLAIRQEMRGADEDQSRSRPPRRGAVDIQIHGLRARDAAEHVEHAMRRIHEAAERVRRAGD